MPQTSKTSRGTGKRLDEAVDLKSGEEAKNGNDERSTPGPAGSHVAAEGRVVFHGQGG
jgi:hypothetical protein